MGEWSAANLQFVWFVADTVGLNPSEIFNTLVGSEPESVQSNKLPRPNNPFLGIAESQIDQMHHRLTIQPGRVDYFVQSAVEGDTGPVLIENPQGLLPQLIVGVSKLKISALRLAFVLNLMKLEPSMAAASKTINELAGNPFPFDDATDVSLQVNRPKVINDIHFNRLLRYSVGVFQFVHVALIPGVMQNSPSATQTFAANVIGDFNTVPSDRVFKSDELTPIWDILFNEAQKFVENRSVKGLD